MRRGLDGRGGYVHCRAAFLVLDPERDEVLVLCSWPKSRNAGTNGNELDFNTTGEERSTYIDSGCASGLDRVTDAHQTVKEGYQHTTRKKVGPAHQPGSLSAASSAGANR
jgi:hypothetical protein